MNKGLRLPRVQIKQRQRLVWELMLDGLTPQQVHLALPHQGFNVCLETVNRDYRAAERADAERHFRSHADLRSQVGQELSRLRRLAALGERRARAQADRSGARWAAVSLQASRDYLASIQSLGLANKELGRLAIDGELKTNRISNAAELHRIFESARLDEGALIPKAEREWLEGPTADGSVSAERHADHPENRPAKLSERVDPVE